MRHSNLSLDKASSSNSVIIFSQQNRSNIKSVLELHSYLFCCRVPQLADKQDNE